MYSVFARNPGPCFYLPGVLGMTDGSGLYHAVTESNTKLIDFSGGFVDIFDQLYFHLGAWQSTSVFCQVATEVMQSTLSSV